MKATPLSDLEMVELLWAAYPERFKGDESDEDWEAGLQLAEDLDGFEDLADLLGRVVMLTIPQRSQLTDTLYHAIGKVEISRNTAVMTAVVKREASQ